MCDVKIVSYNDKPTENYQPTLQPSLALWSILASFIHLVFQAATLMFQFILTALINCFQHQQAARKP